MAGRFLDFTAEMYDRIVRTLGSETPAAADDTAAEARGEPRVGAHGGATAVVGGQPRPVRVRDVSRSGFGLLMVSPVQPGEQFAVSLAGGGAMAGLSIVCSTAYCRPAGHGLYSVGARLLRFSPRM